MCRWIIGPLILKAEMCLLHRLALRVGWELERCPEARAKAAQTLTKAQCVARDSCRYSLNLTIPSPSMRGLRCRRRPTCKRLGEMFDVGPVVVDLSRHPDPDPAGVRVHLDFDAVFEQQGVPQTDRVCAG